MIHYWNKSERFEGTLFKGDEAIGNCKFLFHWNPKDTKKMRVEVFEGPAELTSIDRFIDLPIEIRCDYGERLEYEFDLNFELFSSSMRAREQVVYIPVTKFVSIEKLKKGTPQKVYASMGFPLVKTTETRFNVVSHPSYGYFYGKLENDTSVNLNKDVLELQAEIGKLEMEDKFLFFDSKKSDSHIDYFPGRVLIKQSKLSWEKKVNSNKEVLNAKRAFIYKAEEILSLLSISERDRIDWQNITFTIFGEDTTKGPLEIKKIYQYAGHPTDKLRHNNFKKKELQNFLVNSLNIYEQLNKKKRNEIKDLSRNFQIANLAKTFEDSFIRWHSCLDFLRDKFGRGGKNISKELLKAFEDQDIPLGDILDEDILEEIKSNKEKFPFTDLRNRYVHSGFDVFSGQYQYALNQRRIMRAMAERLLLKRMGIDFRDTHLGKADI